MDVPPLWSGEDAAHTAAWIPALTAFVELASAGMHGSFRRGTVGNNGGRKPKYGEPGVPHRGREAITRHLPVHVTLRVWADVGSLRSRRGYAAVRRATAIAARRDDVRIIDARSAERLDRYSSAAQFDGWQDAHIPEVRGGFEIREPGSWLLRVGWRRHGLLGFTDVPGVSG